MSGALQQIFSFIKELFSWWVTVLPWERGVRVRFGKRVKKLEPGVHLKIPIIDGVIVRCIRERIAQSNLQTVTTLDGHAVSLQIVISYSIEDIHKSINSVASSEAFVHGKPLGLASEYITTHNLEECTPPVLCEYIESKLNDQDLGIKLTHVRVSNFAVVRTYRLIQDTSWGLGFDSDTAKFKEIR